MNMPAIDNKILDLIKQDIESNDVIVYLKGTREAPRCGFSMTVVQILNNLKVPYKDVDVLADEQVREGVKQYNNWPTIPQLFVKGEFIGGADICREMFQSGDLQNLFKEKGLIS